MRPVLILHFGELVLKGRNRSFFENVLLKNIKVVLAATKANFETFYGRIVLETAEGNLGSLMILAERLQLVPGIANIYLGLYLPAAGMQEIKKAIKVLLKNKVFRTFAVRCHRITSKITTSSREIEVSLGDYVQKKFKKRVNLTSPDCTIYIFLDDDGTYVCTQKFEGRDGLPVGTSGKMLSLISGGIDSPVASYLMTTRGAALSYLHFHSYPLTDRGSIEKVKILVKKLQQSQHRSYLFLAPLVILQKKVVKAAPSSLRVILYRKAMLEIGEEIAKKNGLQALITGESLGQVASQTVENLTAASSQIKLPIFRPLIGMNKEEIIQLARRVKTYDISIQDEQDCCSLMLPKTVATKASVQYIDKVVDKLPWQELKNQIITSIEKICV